MLQLCITVIIRAVDCISQGLAFTPLWNNSSLSSPGVNCCNYWIICLSFSDSRSLSLPLCSFTYMKEINTSAENKYTYSCTNWLFRYFLVFINHAVVVRCKLEITWIFAMAGTLQVNDELLLLLNFHLFISCVSMVLLRHTPDATLPSITFLLQIQKSHE